MRPPWSTRRRTASSSPRGGSSLRWRAALQKTCPLVLCFHAQQLVGVVAIVGERSDQTSRRVRRGGAEQPVEIIVAPARGHASGAVRAEDNLTCQGGVGNVGIARRIDPVTCIREQRGCVTFPRPALTFFWLSFIPGPRGSVPAQPRGAKFRDKEVAVRPQTPIVSRACVSTLAAKFAVVEEVATEDTDSSASLKADHHPQPRVANPQ